MTPHPTLSREGVFVVSILLLLSLPMLYLLPVTSRKSFIAYVVIIALWIILIGGLIFLRQ